MTKRKNILFSSVGDNTQFYNLWLDDNRNYDIFLCYYGKEKINKYQEYSDFYIKRKGSKIQNFHHLWNTNKELTNYHNYYIVDDDILIKTNEINLLFDLLDKYNLWILQPSLSSDSKISHDITLNVPNNYMRFTNFIEINTPFFSKYAISKCMEIYDDKLVGYGVDILFIWFLGTNMTDKYAIVDYVTSVNPNIQFREIDKLQIEKDRIYNWTKIKKKFKISNWKYINFEYIKEHID